MLDLNDVLDSIFGKGVEVSPEDRVEVNLLPAVPQPMTLISTGGKAPDVTVDDLRRAFAAMKEPKKWADYDNEFFTKYAINTKLRAAHFLSQVAHESGQFNTVTENLNYTADRLLQVFPKYFSTVSLARSYAHNPQRIASRVYANRLGNGSEGSGDGWAFRGRGLIQLTGRANYAEFGRDINMDLAKVPDYLATPRGAYHSACWFWGTRGLNALADQNSVKLVTKRINGGYNGLKDREELFKRIYAEL